MDIRLANNQDFDYQDVVDAKEAGGKFVTYQWIIPLPLFYPVRRFSKVYFIPPGKNLAAHAFRFNLITLIIGWWGLPWGPIFVYRSLKLNNGGGLDVTDDVYLNLTESNYTNGRFELAKKHTKFVHPAKSEMKDFNKVFFKLWQSEVIESLPVIGQFIDTEDGEEPYVVIGFNESLDGKTDEITKAIYKRFYKQLRFELIDLNQPYDMKEELLSQGVHI